MSCLQKGLWAQSFPQRSQGKFAEGFPIYLFKIILKKKADVQENEGKNNRYGNTFRILLYTVSLTSTYITKYHCVAEIWSIYNSQFDSGSFFSLFPEERIYNSEKSTIDEMSNYKQKILEKYKDWTLQSEPVYTCLKLGYWFGQLSQKSLFEKAGAEGLT